MTTPHHCRRLVLAVLATFLATTEGLRADPAPDNANWPRLYSFELGLSGGDRVAVRLPREPAAWLQLRVTWTGGRHLLLRLKGTDGEVLRRSGPSPLTLDLSTHALATPATSVAGAELSLHALPGRGIARGTIEIFEVAERSHLERAEPRPTAPPDGNSAGGEMSAAVFLSGSVERVAVPSSIESIQTYVTHVTRDEAGPRDACGWQYALVEYFRRADDQLARPARVPPILSLETAKWFARLEMLAAAVDNLRSSKDPIVAGPPPGDPVRRRAWADLRRERLAPIEQELDAMAESLRAGYAGELDEERWPRRLISCLTACQRHFEERGRLGSEEASHGELAEAQWERLRLAASALKSLALVDFQVGELLPR